MSCCCLKRKTPEQIYTQGLHCLHAVKSSNLSKQDIKAFIVALKTLKSAADQDHTAAAYMFGEAVWNCKEPNAIEAIEKAFQASTQIQPGEYQSYGKKSVLLDFRRALAQRYLLQAHASNFPGSEPKLKEIERYALAQIQQSHEAGLIDLQIVSYQKY